MPAYDSQVLQALEAAKEPPSAADSGPIARVLSVLEAITLHEQPASLKDVAERTGLPKATAHRILGQLERMGYLERAIAPKLFLAGPRLATMALAAIRHRWAHHQVHALLVELVKRVHETCNVTVLDGYEALIVDRVETTFPLRYVLQVNARYPLYCSASGKLYLAWMSEERRERYLDGAPFPGRAKRTVTGRKALEEAIRKIRRDAYSIDEEELVTGMIALAVPIFSDARLIGTVAINATSARLTTSDLVDYVPLLRQTAEQIAGFTDAG